MVVTRMNLPPSVIQLQSAKNVWPQPEIIQGHAGTFPPESAKKEKVQS